MPNGRTYVYRMVEPRGAQAGDDGPPQTRPPCPETPDGHHPATGADLRDFDPTTAFLAGDYVAAAALCPQCGIRSDSVVDGQRTCQHCGMVFTQEREHR